MTTNWREKLEALWNRHIPRGEIGAPFLRDAEALIHEARRAAFLEAATLVQGAHEGPHGIEVRLAETLRALAAKEGET